MNPYYERYNTYPPYTVARGDAVQAEFDGVEVGFDRIGSAQAVVVGRLDALSTTVNDLVSTRDAFEIRVSALETHQPNQDAQIAQLQALQAVNTADIESLRQRVQALEDAPYAEIPLHGLSALPAYGFVPVFSTATGLGLAQANSEQNLATAYVIEIDGTRVRAVTEGIFRLPGNNLTPGMTYFLDRATPGITDQRPNTGLSQPVCEAWPNDYVNFFSHRPVLL